MTDRPGASYTVTAGTNGDGTSTALANGQAVRFDSAPGQGDELPGPADLLTAAFAACVLKNVERMGDLLPFGWESASIEVTSHRQDHPPKMTRISYRLEVVTGVREVVRQQRRQRLVFVACRGHGLVHPGRSIEQTVSSIVRSSAQFLVAGRASTAR